MADGRFREDLYYRLNVVPVSAAAAARAADDIVLLAEHFLAPRHRDGGKRLCSDGAARLLGHSWPGNMRELKNAMERVTTLVRRPRDRRRRSRLSRPGKPRRRKTPRLAGRDPARKRLRGLETAMIRRALEASDGNRAQAALRLGIRRQLLYQKLTRYGLALSQNGTEGVPETDAEFPNSTPGTLESQ